MICLLIEKFFSHDFIDYSNTKSLSTSDKIWLENANKSAVLLPDNHLQIDLPLKSNAYFPKNKDQAYKTILLCKNRLDKDPKLSSDYHSFMNQMLEHDFIKGELYVSDEPVWYLLYHVVYHKQKHKIRIVFNASLKYKGISLNDNLLQGPDLTNSLFGVLQRFKEDSVSVTGDIEKMFYQVRVLKSHSNLVRLFWFDHTGKVSEYRIKVHVFGVKSSPSVANFALKRTATESESTVETKNSILNNFYVDD